MTWGEWINSDYNINSAYGLSDSGKVVLRVWILLFVLEWER